MLKPKQQVIADAVINLLHDCPSEASASRKELLVAARHILTTDFRSAFVPYMDVMFNEDVLLGAGITSREMLRYVAL
jgi:transformation/transcription domain-associated protein